MLIFGYKHKKHAKKRETLSIFASLSVTLSLNNNIHTTIMLVFNTTYTMPNADAHNFVIWVHQVYIPRATETSLLSAPRLLRILSHKDEETECFSLQFNVESSAILHKWYNEIGKSLNSELLKMFEERIVGFPTIMEEIEG